MAPYPPPCAPGYAIFFQFTDHHPTQQTADNIILLLYCHIIQ